MIKKYLPYIVLAAGLIALVVMMYTISIKEELGIPLLSPRIIIQAVIAVILMSIGISLILKRI